MKSVAITNRKGGVGKTMLSVSLASWLAGNGYRVLLVDTDPQGNVSKWFNMPEEAGIYDLLVKERPLGSLLRQVPVEQWWSEDTDGVLTVLPGNSATTTAGIVMAVNREPDDLLKMTLQPLQRSDVDFLVFDTSPTVTALMANVLVAADYAIVPTTTEVLSANGVIKTIDDIADDNITRARMGEPLEIISIIPNKHQGMYAEHRDNHRALTNEFGELVWPPLGRFITLEKAPSFGQSIFAYAPKHKASQALAEFGQRFLDAVNVHEEA